MQVQTSIERKLRESLEPQLLEVVNESGMHAVPDDAETHFRVYVVSERFDGKPLVQRHRMIYALLATERASGVHALGMQTLTPAEHEARTAPRAESPPCLGGDAKDRLE